MGVEWFEDSIIYQIFIDRFAGYDSKKGWNKPKFLGGNIQGIIDKLSYLEKLGINTLWISPFYKTSAYHGYHITDYFKVDSHFGELEDLKELIKEVHKRDMKIIADFVPNHCSHKHPYFLKAQKNKESKYRDWFYFRNWPDDYLCFLDVKKLPKINLHHQPAREHIIKAAKYWLDLGLDGYRLDHVIGPSNDFWRYFKREIKSEFSDAVLMGEAWMKSIKFKELETLKVRRKYLKWSLGAASDLLLKEYLGLLDGVLDFKFQTLVKNHIAHENILPHWLLNLRLRLHYMQYPDYYFLPSFLDNHDMNRFLFEAGNNKERLKRAAELQFSLDQPPIIYYGTEVGMNQEKPISAFKSHGDLQARKPMKWEKQDKDLFKFYRNLIKKRKGKNLG